MVWGVPLGKKLLLLFSQDNLFPILLKFSEKSMCKRSVLAGLFSTMWDSCRVSTTHNSLRWSCGSHWLKLRTQSANVSCCQHSKEKEKRGEEFSCDGSISRRHSCWNYSTVTCFEVQSNLIHLFIHSFTQKMFAETVPGLRFWANHRITICLLPILTDFTGCSIC